MAGETFEGVVTFLDEIKAWECVLHCPTSPAISKKQAGQVLEELEPLRLPFQNMLTLSNEAFMELVEVTCEAADGLWRLTVEERKLGQHGRVAFYSQARMSNFLTLVGKAFHSTLCTHLEAINLWADHFPKVELGLTQALRLAEKWEHATVELTQLTWPMHEDHLWVGEPFKDIALAKFHARVRGIKRIREVHQRLVMLVSDVKRRSLAERDVFQSFSTLPVFEYSFASERQWKAAQLEYEEKMLPIEGKIALKLQELFCSSLLPLFDAALSQNGGKSTFVTAEPHQVMGELRRFKELYEDPLVIQCLASEGKRLVSLFGRHVEYLRKQLEDQCALFSNLNDDPEGASALPQHCHAGIVVKSIYWLLQHAYKVEETSSTMDALMPILKAGALDDTSQSGLENELSDLLQDISDYKQSQHKLWEMGVRANLKTVSLETSERLLRLDPIDGHVEVTFHDELVTIICETRQLVILGFTIDPEIKKAVETAQNFQKQGMMLKQVASFYNEIATQMIPCQKIIMLQDALRLEAILKNPCDSLGKPIHWKNVQAVQSYTERLQEITTELSEKNRELQRQHSKLVHIVKNLLTVGLQHHQAQWKRCLREMSDVFDDAEAKGFTQLNEWRLHWDAQVSSEASRSLCFYSTNL